MTDLSQLAKSLTKAQREALHFASEHPVYGWVCRPGRSSTGMAEKGLIGRFYITSMSGNPTGYRQLTPTGAALRAHLKGQTDADA